ncbi:putative leader peptide [Streptomyces sp. NPDC046860]|uniref:putative leader peptide n=1 Tax=Streptomyces sp. NPDC046860 TaxID=3154495 RepID=UPI0033D1CC22
MSGPPTCTRRRRPCSAVRWRWRTRRRRRRRPVRGRADLGSGSRCPHGDDRLTGVRRRAVLRIVTDTRVRLWRRVHMDLLRYAGCVCRPSC